MNNYNTFSPAMIMSATVTRLKMHAGFKHMQGLYTVRTFPREQESFEELGNQRVNLNQKVPGVLKQQEIISGTKVGTKKKNPVRISASEELGKYKLEL